MGGLACAVALAQYPDIQVDIYEAASRFAEVGAGVGVWPRAWKVVQALGLDHELAEVAVVAPDHHPSEYSGLLYWHLARLRRDLRHRTIIQFPQGRSVRGPYLLSAVYPWYVRLPTAPATPAHHNDPSPAVGGLVTVHRPEFQQILLRHLAPSARTYTNKRLTSFSQRPSGTLHKQPVTLHFQDGATATCDVLVGADGVKSATRAGLVEELARAAMSAGRADEAVAIRSKAQPRWSGLCAYRTTIPTEDLRSRMPTHTLLREPMAVSFVSLMHDMQYLNSRVSGSISGMTQ